MKRRPGGCCFDGAGHAAGLTAAVVQYQFPAVLPGDGGAALSGTGIRRWLLVHGSGDFIAGSFSITIAAQLATMPVLAWYFNQLSLSSLLANLLVVPIVEFMIVVGLFAGIVAFLLPICGRLVFTLTVCCWGWSMR
ncbi:MAG: ComEC/Rec2 family competence protein [Selenomonas sp.]|nr:ComEC/Rec2 family competence protein [Selenomonas sp.]